MCILGWRGVSLGLLSWRGVLSWRWIVVGRGRLIGSGCQRGFGFLGFLNRGGNHQGALLVAGRSGYCKGREEKEDESKSECWLHFVREKRIEGCPNS